MIIHITLWTKVSHFCYTIKFSKFRWHFGTILTIWRFGDHLLMRINSKVNQIHGQNLIILIHNILMLIKLNIFLLIIQINRLKPFWQRHYLVHKLLNRTTIRFSYSDFVQYEAKLILWSEWTSRSTYLVVANSEYHTILFYLVTLRDDFG